MPLLLLLLLLLLAVTLLLLLLLLTPPVRLRLLSLGRLEIGEHIVRQALDGAHDGM